MNDRKQSIGEFPIKANILGALLKKVADGEITNNSAKTVFADLITLADEGHLLSVEYIDHIIAIKNLAIVSDTSIIEQSAEAVIARNEKVVESFRGGKENAIGALIGQVIHEVRADPKLIREILIRKIKGEEKC